MNSCQYKISLYLLFSMTCQRFKKKLGNYIIYRCVGQLSNKYISDDVCNGMSTLNLEFYILRLR